MTKGIDISHWNGEIDFNRVKADGIEFVIIKAGGSDKGFYMDPKFKDNYNKAKAAGLMVGAYYFAGKNFRGVENGLFDAERFLMQLKGLEFEYPVFLDIEAQDNRYKEEITDAATAFCSYLETSHYFVGIYASDVSGFKYKLDHDRIKSFVHWVARYGREPEVCKEYGIWQYSSRGYIPGISGPVDLDISKMDYSKVIKENGLNGFKAEKKTKPKKKEGKKDGI